MGLFCFGRLLFTIIYAPISTRWGASRSTSARALVRRGEPMGVVENPNLSVENPKVEVENPKVEV